MKRPWRIGDKCWVKYDWSFASETIYYEGIIEDFPTKQSPNEWEVLVKMPWRSYLGYHLKELHRHRPSKKQKVKNSHKGGK